MRNKNRQAFALLFILTMAVFLSVIVSASVPEEGCNLELTKSVCQTSAHPGDIITFTLTYENTGDSECTGGGVKIEDVLDENLLYEGDYDVELLDDNDSEGIYYGWQEIPGFNETTNTLTWNAHVVSPGEKGIITIEVKVLEKEECGNYEIENFFRTWSDQEGWEESNRVNISVEDECYTPACGNGILDEGNDEECDDGNLVDGDGCSSTCEIEEECECCPVCGNGILETGEECDDGNKINGDGCSKTCKTEETEEECDTCKKCDDKDKSNRIVEFCEPNWVCSGWGECANGFMTRKCTDKNNCDTDYGKPYEQTSCTEKAISTAYVVDGTKTRPLSIWAVIGMITAILLLIILIILIG